jgi:hypothetical protein
MFLHVVEGGGQLYNWAFLLKCASQLQNVNRIPLLRNFFPLYYFCHLQLGFCEHKMFQNIESKARLSADSR